MRPLYRTLAIGVLAGTLAACSDDGTSTVAAADDDQPNGIPVGETDADGTPSAEGPFDTETDAPVVPGAPTDPDAPVVPGAPTDPDAPVVPGAPTDPDAPVVPGAPTDPDAPVVPGAPTDPDTPVVPGAPTDPDAPVVPGAPTDPDAPVVPGAPTDPDAPVVPGAPTDPAVPPTTGIPTDEDVTFSGTDRNSCEDRVLSIYVRTLSEVCSVEVNGGSRTDFSRTDDAPSAPTGLTALLVADDWTQLDWIPSADDGAVVAYEIYRDAQLVGTVRDPDVIPAGEPQPRAEAERYWRTTTYLDCDYTRFACATQPQPGASHVYTVVAIDGAGNRSPRSAPLTVTMNTIQPGAAAPDPASEGYELVFGDEFDGDRLDRDNWTTSLGFSQFLDDGRVVNGEQQYFVRLDEGIEIGFNPYQVGNGVLSLTADRTEDALPAESVSVARGQPYLSGVISSRSKFEGLRYGYAEVRAKVPSGDGLLATFFLFQSGGNQYEIDILEYLGRIPDGATQNYHYRDGFRFPDNGFQGVPHVSPTMEFDGGVDLSEDFHTYSALWEPGLVIWYIDGQEVRRLTGPRVSDVEMDFVAQFVIGSPNFAGDPSGVDFPVSYDIDYIRGWQR